MVWLVPVTALEIASHYCGAGQSHGRSRAKLHMVVVVKNVMSSNFYF